MVVHYPISIYYESRNGHMRGIMMDIRHLNWGFVYPERSHPYLILEISFFCIDNFVYTVNATI